MALISFYNGTYKSGDLLQKLTSLDVQNRFGFQYMESNLRQTLKNCQLPKWMKSYPILETPEEYIAIHKTCSNVNIGYGLVATKNIPAGVIAFDYLGIKEEDRNDFFAMLFGDHDKADKAYFFKLGNGMGINAKHQGHLIRFGSHLPSSIPHLLEETSVMLANLQAAVIRCVDGGHVFFFTKKNIYAGEELGYDYMDSYGWSNKLYFINSKSKECFTPEFKNVSYSLKHYSKIIDEYQKDLNSDGKEKVITKQNLINALRLRGDAHASSDSLENKIKASNDYGKALMMVSTTGSFSLETKAYYIKLLGDNYADTIPLYIKNFCSEYMDTIYMYVKQANTKQEANKFVGFLTSDIEGQCFQKLSSYLVHISKELFSYIQKSQCCTENQDGTFFLEYEHKLLVNMMCDIENGYHTDDVFIEHCNPLEGLLQQDIVHDDDEHPEL